MNDLTPYLARIAHNLELRTKTAWYHVEPLSERGQRLRAEIEKAMDE